MLLDTLKALLYKAYSSYKRTNSPPLTYKFPSINIQIPLFNVHNKTCILNCIYLLCTYMLINERKYEKWVSSERQCFD